MKGKINRNQLKYIAILAMLIDHLAWAFVPCRSILGQGMHFIGRLTGPIMAFMLAEGYLHTRNVKRYAIRLGIFALASWVPYCLNDYGKWPKPFFGVILTLFLALLTCWMWDKWDAKKPAKIAVVVVMCALSIMGDWSIWDILWPLFFVIYRNDEKKKWRAFLIVAALEIGLSQCIAIFISKNPYEQAFQVGALLVMPLIRYGYNGEPGSRNAFHKWFFYVFYPLHLMILFFLKMYIN